MNQIICPHCGKEVELTKALFHEVEEKISKDLELKQKENLERATQEAINRAKKEFEEEQALRVKNFQNEIEELKKKRQQSEAEFLERERKIRTLEDEIKSSKVEIEKKVREESERIRKEEEYKAKLEKLELEKKLSDTQKALEEAQRKSKQGSQQLQGEVLELDFETQLANNFVYDEITPIPKGVSGGDVWQKVKNSKGQTAGLILWETKRTKTWTTGWLPKLREDMRTSGASLAVLVTESLPPQIKHFGYLDGIWITTYQYAIALATVLRSSLMQIAAAKSAAANKDEKLEDLYKYLTSEAFRHRFEAQVEAAVELQNDLEVEKRAILRVWKRREVQIKRLIGNTANLYGELQGIVGPALPTIKALEEPQIKEDELEEKEQEELKLIND